LLRKAQYNLNPSSSLSLTLPLRNPNPNRMLPLTPNPTCVQDDVDGRGYGLLEGLQQLGPHVFCDSSVHLAGEILAILAILAILIKPEP